MNRHLIILILSALLLVSSRVFAQPGSKNFDKVWVQGESLTFSTTFDSVMSPDNQIIRLPSPLYLTGGNSGICDSAGNLLLICDGYSLYDKNLDVIDGGKLLVPQRITVITGGFGPFSQSSIILPFGNGKYRLFTPTVSDDSSSHAVDFDLLLYDEIDMNANGGAGKVTKRMVPLLENVHLSKTQMMACRHGDGKSWWLLKQAADTNVVYKFLFTEDTIYGPYIQGFSGAAARFGVGDWFGHGQSMFSKDGTRYASTQLGYGKVFIADFERCTGMLSNPQVYDVPAQLAGNPGETTDMDKSTCGLSFSPNGRYLYVSSLYNVQQLDLLNPFSPSAWTFLSGPDTVKDEFQLYSNIYPGPDGKLYIGNWNGFSGQMSVINTPDMNGTAAGFCRKCLRFPGFMIDTVFRFAGVSTPPCMPNYSLGPTNPVCYPTGIQPLAKDATFLLFPNPSHGTIEVKYETAGELRLYDVTGRVVGLFNLQSPNGIASISVSHLAAGVYQYQYISKDLQRRVGKLVIAL